jgi:hypothetical protein
MHQPSEPKSLSDWEEVGNPLILHNKVYLLLESILLKVKFCSLRIVTEAFTYDLFFLQKLAIMAGINAPLSPQLTSTDLS